LGRPGDEGLGRDDASEDVVLEDGHGDAGIVGVPYAVERRAGDVLKGFV
jgi:hypothetical protein